MTMMLAPQLLLLVLLVVVAPVQGFILHVHTHVCIWTPTRQRQQNILSANKKNEDGYKFGDFTKSILGGAGKALGGAGKKLTGKNDYEFGDITKGAINEFTGKEDYQFGDLTRSLDQKSKEKAVQFTGKTDYQVGDLSKEILRRAKEGDYKVEDIVLICKIMVTVGAEFSPLASMLPAKLLLEMMNYSLAQEVGGKFLEVIMQTLDKRFKEAVTGDADYEVGDLTKKAIMKFIGKEEGEYEFGDLSRTISKKVQEKDSSGQAIGTTGVILDAEFVKELEEWDSALKLDEAKPLKLNEAKPLKLNEAKQD